ncbi:heat shock protein transcriptional repressor HspR [Solicola gregarius]|uniref:heat shock protein transcriptional repressor HspR n=1 Tax=Solicola gregarius TaxID=2908642 RepID=UPI0038CD70DB
MSEFIPPGPEAKVFVISVAAELSGLHPQTLRTYDRLGIVSPGRTGGGGRRYSLSDIELLRDVARLTAEGLGLEGVKRVLRAPAHRTCAAGSRRVARVGSRGGAQRARVDAEPPRPRIDRGAARRGVAA